MKTSTHKTDVIGDVTLGRMLNPIKFWVFMRSGYYSAGSEWRWNRLPCWFGWHNLDHGFSSTFCRDGYFYVKPQCNRCGCLMEYKVTAVFKDEQLILDILQGGLIAKKAIKDAQEKEAKTTT